MFILRDPEAGGGGDAGATQGTIADGAAAEIPTGDLPAAPTDFSIPEAYKEAGWAKDLKSHDDLFKMMDETKAMVGKRPGGIPQDTAPDEDWLAFNKAFGVPEKGEGYTFVDLPEGQELNADFRKGMTELMHKAGVSQRQLAVLDPGFNTLMEQLGGGEDGAQADAEFNEMATKLFGEREDAVLKNAQLMVTQLAPEEMKGHWDGLDNKTQLVIASILDTVKQKYISEDDIPSDGLAPAASTKESKIAEGTALMQHEAYNNVWHPEHKAIRLKVDQAFGNA